MSTETQVTSKDLHELLQIFERKSFDAGSCEEGTLEEEITNKCELLFKKDYTVIELDNSNGILCPRYPGRIFIPEYEHGHMSSTNNTSILPQSTPPTNTTNVVPPTNAMTNTTTNTIYEDLYDISKIRELITMAKYARCRQRFVIPVIMYRGKYICRSATISVNAETYGRKVVDYAYDYLNGTNYSDRGNNIVDYENNDNNEESLLNQVLNETSPFSYEEVIKSDILLLNALNVNTIVDLMVEKRKIKYFLAVSSSEKADADNHYESFNLLSMPYPGCEFFKSFRDNNYMARNLYYNWNQSFNDANISIPNLGPTTELNINWNEYKNWDLVLITQNYMKACLKYIQEEKSGLLIHCISGWDRTPLFISLLRLSLWADGLIHKSLSAEQITYLTLAYDWYLFGHQLPDRLKRGEDIMFFCFHVLKFLYDEEFQIVEHSNRKRTKTSSSSGSNSIALPKPIDDDEPVKDKEDLCCDQDSNDSLTNCDMSITDNFFATAMTASTATSTTATHSLCNNIGGVANPLTNRSPNPKRSKTSPISVPGASAQRKRQDSTSSNGSWLVVTETGSLDSTMNDSNIRMQQDENSCHGSNSSTNDSDSTNGATSNATDNVNTKDGSSEKKAPPSIRQQRLHSVRATFIQAYGKTVGLKFKEGSSMNIVTFVGNLADQLF